MARRRLWLVRHETWRRDKYRLEVGQRNRLDLGNLHLGLDPGHLGGRNLDSRNLDRKLEAGDVRSLDLALGILDVRRLDVGRLETRDVRDLGRRSQRLSKGSRRRGGRDRHRGGSRVDPGVGAHQRRGRRVLETGPGGMAVAFGAQGATPLTDRVETLGGRGFGVVRHAGTPTARR